MPQRDQEVQLYTGLSDIYCETILVLWVKFPLKNIKNNVRKLFTFSNILTILPIFEKNDCRI